MNRMRALLGGDIPLVAVVFRDNDSERLAREALAAGVDVAELRIDQFSRTDADHVLSQVAQFSLLPTLATVRAEREGGEWHGTEASRLALFRSIVPAVDAVDIELSSSEILKDVVELAKHHDKVVIVSHHDFDSTASLEALEAIVDEGKGCGADYVKVATMARSNTDLRTLAQLTLNAADRGVVVVAMGSTGALSRVFFPALGSKLTYASIGDRSAPGQLDFTETFDALRRYYPDFDQKKLQILEDV